MEGRTLRVTYVLPKLVDHPVGGFKVHYQYANELAARGHKVTVVHPATTGFVPSARELASFAAAALRRRLRGGGAVPWFALDERVGSSNVVRLRPASLPDGDVLLLTAWQTAERTVGAPPRAGRSVQIVFDYEHWLESPALRPRIARALGRPDVTRIATSAGVASLLEELGARAVATVTPGLAAGEFGLDVPVALRGPVVTFALRHGLSKDMATAFAAVAQIRQAVPDAEIRCFGDPSQAAPASVRHLGRLEQRALRRCYNETAVFLLTSRHEGWGLPAAEAMACGAAVVSTRNGGTEEFVRDGANGLLVPAADPGAVAAAAVRLLGDEDLRASLGARAAGEALQMTVERATDRVEEVLRRVAHR